jgi:hypothetical protein
MEVGSVKMWNCGSMKMWNCESVKVWKQESMEVGWGKGKIFLLIFPFYFTVCLVVLFSIFFPFFLKCNPSTDTF